MKFDFDPVFVQGVLNFLQEAPVPHKLIDPMLKLIVSQSTDPRIQSLAYPPDSPEVPHETAAPVQAGLAYRTHTAREHADDLDNKIYNCEPESVLNFLPDAHTRRDKRKSTSGPRDQVEGE